MIYRIAFEADKHWGAMRMEEQYRSSYILKRFLAEYPIDLYVFLGDFFDTKLLLNSRSSVFAIRDFVDKIEICRSRGIPCRAIKGTRYHDYDQWDVFSSYMADPNCNFKYFRTCTVEETLPGLRIWYGPEENLSFTNYVDQYYDILTEKPINMAALHGSFDRIMPSVAVQALENNADSTTLVYRYDDLEPLVRGPMVAGHWHDGEAYQHLSYVGSFDRWTFGEDEPKGFAIYEYDTETMQYRSIKVPNFLAAQYITYEVRTSIFTKPKEYTKLAEVVDLRLHQDTTTHIRVLCRIDEIKPDTDQQIENLKLQFANNRRVHMTIVNQVKQEKKKSAKQEKKKRDEVLGFIYDKNLDLAEKIQKYIEATTGKEYTAGEIRKIIERYVMN